MNAKTILVLGGGIGGLVASNMLKDKLAGQARVLLVEKKERFQFPPSYPWLMLGRRRPDQVQKDLSALKRKGIEVLNDEVLSIDVERKLVETREHELGYDYLIIALGADYAPEMIPGFNDHAHHIYDLESAVRFRDALRKFSGGTLAVGISRIPFKCPAAPYEVALLLDDYFTRIGIREKVRFEFFTLKRSPFLR